MKYEINIKKKKIANLMVSLNMFTFPSGKTWIHSPAANFSMQKSMASWYTPPPLITGMHLPSIKKYECQEFVKQMSWAASDHLILRRSIRYLRSRLAKWVQRFFCLKFFHSIAYRWSFWERKDMIQEKENSCIYEGMQAYVHVYVSK